MTELYIAYLNYCMKEIANRYKKHELTAKQFNYWFNLYWNQLPKNFVTTREEFNK